MLRALPCPCTLPGGLGHLLPVLGVKGASISKTEHATPCSPRCSLPRGMYLSLEDKGSVFSILKNWPERRIKAICLTDGQSVGHLGDLGVQVRVWPLIECMCGWLLNRCRCTPCWHRVLLSPAQHSRAGTHPSTGGSSLAGRPPVLCRPSALDWCVPLLATAVYTRVVLRPLCRPLVCPSLAWRSTLRAAASCPLPACPSPLMPAPTTRRCGRWGVQGRGQVWMSGG